MRNELPELVIETVQRLFELLAARDYVEIERLTNGVRLSATDMQRAIDEYGCRVEPTDRQFILTYCSAIPLADTPNAWHVVCSLKTTEESRSDLSIELTLFVRGSGVTIEIDDLHVL